VITFPETAEVPEASEVVAEVRFDQSCGSRDFLRTPKSFLSTPDHFPTTLERCGTLSIIFQISGARDRYGRTCTVGVKDSSPLHRITGRFDSIRLNFDIYRKYLFATVLYIYYECHLS
jgi:hypothetical protein